MSKIAKTCKRRVIRFWKNANILIMSWSKRRRLFTERTLIHALQESEQRFRTIADFTYDWEDWVDPQGKSLYVSPSCERITGYPPREFLNNPDFLVHITHPHDLAMIANHQEAIAPHPDVCSLDFRIINRQGEERWIGHICQPVFATDGRWLGRRASNRDITERKQAEEDLRRLNERFALAARAAYLGVWDLDIQKNELVWDDRMYELYGVKREDFGGAYEAWLQGVHPDDATHSHAEVQQAQRGEKDFDTEFRIVRPDGVVRWLKAYGQVMRNEAGNPLRMTGVNYDITDRKLAEQALHQSEKELQLTLEATTDGIWKWNFVTETMFFSPRYYTMLGYEPGEFLVSYESWSNLIHPNDRERALATATEYLATKPDVYENEFRLRTKRGDYRWIYSYARVVERNDRGEALRMIGNHVDITDRKHAEGAIQESEMRLRAATDASLDDFFVLRSERDAAGRIRDFVFVDLNTRDEKMLQLDRAQLIGKGLCEVLPINRTAGFFEKYVRVVETGVPLEEEFFLPDTHVPAAWYYH